MRALRDPDAFMPTDLGVRRALERLGQDASGRAAIDLAERWRPYTAAPYRDAAPVGGAGLNLQRALGRALRYGAALVDSIARVAPATLDQGVA